MLDQALAVAQKENIYYYGSKTMKKQSIATVQRTNFVQSLASLSGGQSVITISPSDGVSHFILGLELQPIGGSLTYAGLALNRAWAYDAIDYIQWRYGSSSLYQKSGAQLLVEAIATAGSQSEANNLMTLAGNALTTPTDFEVPDNLYAYAVLPLPHCGAQSGTECPNPFPTELLNAPIVITIALKRQQDLFKSAIASPVYPGAFKEAYLQVRQINAIDRGELWKISPSVSYGFPTTFFQQVNSVGLANTASDQEIVLTGFRSGSCKGIHCWMVDETDTSNPFRFILPRDMVLSYAGNVIHNYKGVSSSLLDTLFVDCPSYFNNVVITDAGSTWTVAPEVSYWTHFPLSQRFEQLSAEYTETTGLGVANGLMNLRLKTPDARSSYKLYYVPYYSTALLFNNGTCEYVF